MNKISEKNLRKKNRVRYKIKKTKDLNRPRLSVFRSINNVYAQIIDDTKGITLAACSSLQKNVKTKVKNTGNIQAAKIVGENIAKIAIEKGIKNIVFDRGQYLYHGRVKALAQAAREQGLIF